MKTLIAMLTLSASLSLFASPIASANTFSDFKQEVTDNARPEVIEEVSEGAQEQIQESVYNNWSGQSFDYVEDRLRYEFNTDHKEDIQDHTVEKASGDLAEEVNQRAQENFRPVADYTVDYDTASVTISFHDGTEKTLDFEEGEFFRVVSGDENVNLAVINGTTFQHYVDGELSAERELPNWMLTLIQQVY